MYVTSTPLSLLSYYVEKEENVQYTIYRIDKEKELNKVLGLGDCFSPTLSLIEYKGKPPQELKVGIFNKVYMSVEDLKLWEIINKDWLKIIHINPEIYKFNLQKYRNIFEEDVEDYLWDKWKFYPKKLEAELMLLLIKYGNRKTKIKLEELIFNNTKTTNIFFQACKGLGNVDNSKLLFNLSDSNLFQLFIGSEKKFSYIYYYLIGNKKKEGTNPELYQAVEILREAVLNNLVPIQTGAVLLNNWICNLSKIKTNHKKSVFNINFKELNNLENLLKGL